MEIEREYYQLFTFNYNRIYNKVYVQVAAAFYLLAINRQSKGKRSLGISISCSTLAFVKKIFLNGMRALTLISRSNILV